MKSKNSQSAVFFVGLTIAKDVVKLYAGVVMKIDTKKKLQYLTSAQKTHAEKFRTEKEREKYIDDMYRKNGGPNKTNGFIKSKGMAFKIATVAVCVNLAVGCVLAVVLGTKSCSQNPGYSNSAQPFNGGNLSVKLQDGNFILAERKPGTVRYKVITTAMYNDTTDVKTFSVNIPEGQMASVSIGGKEYDQLNTNSNASQLSKVNVIAYDKNGKELGRGTGNYSKQADASK